MPSNIRIHLAKVNVIVGVLFMISLAVHGAGIKIDDFESYSTGDLSTVASGIWIDSTGGAADVKTDGVNKFAAVGWTGGSRGSNRTLPSGTTLGDGETGVYFLRIGHQYGFAADGYASYGFSYSTATDGIDRTLNNYEVLLAINDQNNLAAGNGSTTLTDLGFGVPADQWVNVWLEVDNSTDTFNVYANTDAFSGEPAFPANADLVASGYAFVNGSDTQALQSFLLAGNAVNTSNATAFADDIYLVVPEPATMVCFLLGGIGLLGRPHRQRTRFSACGGSTCRA